MDSDDERIERAEEEELYPNLDEGWEPQTEHDLHGKDVCR